MFGTNPLLRCLTLSVLSATLHRTFVELVITVGEGRPANSLVYVRGIRCPVLTPRHGMRGGGASAEEHRSYTHSATYAKRLASLLSSSSLCSFACDDWEVGCLSGNDRKESAFHLSNLHHLAAVDSNKTTNYVHVSSPPSIVH